MIMSREARDFSRRLFTCMNVQEDTKPFLVGISSGLFWLSEESKCVARRARSSLIVSENFKNRAELVVVASIEAAGELKLEQKTTTTTMFYHSFGPTISCIRAGRREQNGSPIDRVEQCIVHNPVGQLRTRPFCQAKPDRCRSAATLFFSSAANAN